LPPLPPASTPVLGGAAAAGAALSAEPRLSKSAAADVTSSGTGTEYHIVPPTF
jgi:hypothetical protein